MSLKGFLLRWVRGPINIMQGVAQTLSLGLWEPTWAQKANVRYLAAVTAGPERYEAWNDPDETARMVRTLRSEPSPEVAAVYARLAQQSTRVTKKPRT